jgi:hypothetical protein
VSSIVSLALLKIMAERWQDSVTHVKEERRTWFDNMGDQIMINVG